MRRHRLIERFLTDVLGIPWDDVHEEAERLEHAMSPKLEERMAAAIGDAKTCPHGHPLSPGDRVEGVPLADVEQGAKVTVLRFENEAEDLLHLFKNEGLAPGKEGEVAEADDDHVVVAVRRRHRDAHPLGVGDRLGDRRPVAAAAHGAARAARARQGALRPLGDAARRGVERARARRARPCRARGRARPTRRRSACRAARRRAGSSPARGSPGSRRAAIIAWQIGHASRWRSETCEPRRAGSRGEPSSNPSGASHSSFKRDDQLAQRDRLLPQRPDARPRRSAARPTPPRRGRGSAASRP